MSAGDWKALDDRGLALLAAVVVDVAREIGRRVPAPRGMPFHGLDHPAGDLGPYANLAAHGIFRKYESVLLIGADLGGAARWCHTHFGCDVTGIEPRAALCAAAQRLSARAGAAAHTRFVAAEPAHLPVAARRFTHVWAVGGLADLRPGDPRLAEIQRAVRLGGIVALQQIDAGRDWCDRAAAALLAAGLVEPRVEVVESRPPSHAMGQARGQLLRALERFGVEGRALAAALGPLYDRCSGEVAVHQVLARRPS